MTDDPHMTDLLARLGPPADEVLGEDRPLDTPGTLGAETSSLPTSDGVSGPGGDDGGKTPGGALVLLGSSAPRPRSPQHKAPSRHTGAWIALAFTLGALGMAAVDLLWPREAPVQVVDVAGVPVDIGQVPERGTQSRWRPDAPTLVVEALGISADLGQGTDAGPGPVVLTGTPWPGGEGRSVVLVNADLSGLRIGDHLEVTGESTWTVHTLSEAGEGDLAQVTAQPAEGAQLVLLEARSFRDGPRFYVTAWRTS